MKLENNIIILLVLIFSSQALYNKYSKVVQLTAGDFQEKVIKSNQLWIVEFYAPWCGHCKSLAPEFDKAAIALLGVVGVGAVDMTAHGSVGEPYGIQGYPTLKIFGEDKKKPSDYSGGRTSSAIIDTMVNEVTKMVNTRSGKKSSSGGSGSGKKSGGGGGASSDGDVVILTEDNFDEQVLNSNDPWFVEFYAPWCGHCKSLEPKWNEMATTLKGTVKVGKVDATVHGSLGQKFGVSGYPTIKFFNTGKKSTSSAMEYNGGREVQAMVDFALQTTGKSLKAPFEQLVKASEFKELCKDFQGVCVNVFLPHMLDSSVSERKAYVKTVEDAITAKKTNNNIIHFAWHQGGDQPELEKKFQIGINGYPVVLGLTFSKGYHNIMKGGLTDKNFKQYIDLTLAGKQFKKFDGDVKIKDVKAWDGKEAKQDL